MPLSHLNRRRFCHVVGIIVGPQEPSNVDPYVEDLLEEFIKYGPQGRPGFQCNSSTQAAVVDEGPTTFIQGRLHDVYCFPSICEQMCSLVLYIMHGRCNSWTLGRMALVLLCNGGVVCWWGPSMCDTCCKC